jgi:sulfite reductase beta subunit-like hemoprotein
MLARVAREFDLQDAGRPTERGGFGHFTTRQNLQFNWIALERSAEVMDLLASVDMHGIQTSGNCIRNISSDAFAGIAADEEVDPRPYCEILRQWSTPHPEFAFLPRKFKIAVTGAREDRAATAWHDIGLQLHRNATGEVGFRVAVGGGMGRTPVIATELAAFVPWAQILVFIEAIVRIYNLFGRRDNAYKARIKILVRAEGPRFVDAVQREFAALLDDPATSLVPGPELDRVAAHFDPPVAPRARPQRHARHRHDARRSARALSAARRQRGVLHGRAPARRARPPPAGRRLAGRHRGLRRLACRLARRPGRHARVGETGPRRPPARRTAHRRDRRNRGRSPGGPGLGRGRGSRGERLTLNAIMPHDRMIAFKGVLRC